VIQKIADKTGKELEADLIWETFKKNYININGKIGYVGHEITSKNDSRGSQIDEIVLSINDNGENVSISGSGNGPIDSFINAMANYLKLNIKVSDYHQHAISSGSDASAAAYIELDVNKNTVWGIGIDSNTVIASFKAIISGLNKSN
jgi:2-isopropylmalate synthase